MSGFSNKEKDIREKIELLNRLIETNNDLKHLGVLIQEVNQRKELNNKEIRISNSRLEVIRLDIDSLIQKKNSFVGKFFSFVSSKVDYEKEINSLISEQHSIEDTLVKLKQIDKEFSIKSDRLNLQKKNIKEEVDEYSALLTEYDIDILKDTSSLDVILSKERAELQKEIDSIEVYSSLAQEYEGYSELELRTLLGNFRKEEKKLANYSIEARMEKALVIGATIDTFLFRYKDKTPDFSHIFIDEAGYASVVKALTVFTTKTPITLLGDHKQLPPVCEISKTDIQKDDALKSVFTWDLSAIFISDVWVANNKDEALKIYFNSKTPSVENLKISSLTESHRFGPNLADVLDRYVYDIGFKASRRNREDTKILICNVTNPYEARNYTRMNQAEAIAIQQYIKSNFTVTESVAILAPYRAQIDSLKKLLPDFKDEDKILTVHKSQGREWNTVIYSVCDIGNGKSPWFTDSLSTISNGLNNVNTAVSRAKKTLIIFCCIDEWKEREEQLIAGLLSAGTHQLDIDSSQYEFKQVSVTTNSKGKVKAPKATIKTTSGNSIKGKDYIPSTDNEEWESKTLYWSKAKKAGFKYSAKKDAWWKKK